MWGGLSEGRFFFFFLSDRVFWDVGLIHDSGVL